MKEHVSHIFNTFSNSCVSFFKQVTHIFVMSIFSVFCIFFTVIEKEIGEHLHARTLTEEKRAFILTLNPGHILAFATGSSRVSAIGFLPSPKLTFVHDDTKHIPVAYTCSHELQIFVNRNNLTDDDGCVYHILVAIFSVV